VSRAAVVVIAVGNEMRGDDAAGIRAAGLLEARLPAGVELARTRGDATELMALWRGRALAVVVDAVDGGGAPGAVLEIDALADGLPPGLASASTHDFGLAQGLVLSRLMDALPQRLVVIGIVGERYAIGDEISPAVDRALKEAADRVTAAIANTGAIHA